MVDGKVVSLMLDIGSASCNFCSATPTQMQNVDECTKRKVNKLAIEFGLSPLHMWMRCAEFFLKIGYRLKIQLPRISKKSDDKAIELSEKRRMQTQFYEQLGGLKVDFPNPSGGNTNDGNTCRKLFRNYEVNKAEEDDFIWSGNVSKLFTVTFVRIL